MLLRKMLRGHVQLESIDLERTLHWSIYSAKSIAQIQARGMLIDMPRGIWFRKTSLP